MGRVLAAVDRFEARIGAVAERSRRANPPLPRGAGWALVLGLASPMWVRVARPLLIVAWIALSYAPVPTPLLAVLLVIGGLVILVLENRARRDLRRAAGCGQIRLTQDPDLTPRRAATTAAGCFAAAIGLSLVLAALGMDEQLAGLLAMGACVLTLMWVDHRSAKQ